LAWAQRKQYARRRPVNRSPSVILVVAAILFGPITQAHAINPIVAQLTAEYGLDAAKVIAKVLWDQAKAATCEKCVSHVRSASLKADKNLAACLTLSKSVEVVMQEKAGNKILLELRINVEVVALYPLKEVRYFEGKIVLPQNPKILAGFIEPEGKRGTWQGENDWDRAKCQQVAESLAYKSLEPAKEKFKESQVLLEYQFKKDVDDEIERLMKLALKKWAG
jgi:hypothetical protein